MVSRFVHEPDDIRRENLARAGEQRKNLDWQGIVLMTIGLATLQYVLEEGSRNDWFQSTAIVVTTFIAGIALGSLSMKTKSIYQGFMLHITVAALMDWASLRHRKATPIHWWAPDAPVLRTMQETWDEERLRESIAVKVENGALVVFAAIIVFFVVMFLRTRRARLERRWLLPEPRP